MLEGIEFTNAITKFLDTKINDEHRIIKCMDTVLTKAQNNLWCIRFFGATRGCVIINDDNIIQDIILYPETSFDKPMACYEQFELNELNIFKGLSLNIK